MDPDELRGLLTAIAIVLLIGVVRGRHPLQSDAPHPKGQGDDGHCRAGTGQSIALIPRSLTARPFLQTGAATSLIQRRSPVAAARISASRVNPRLCLIAWARSFSIAARDSST